MAWQPTPFFVPLMVSAVVSAGLGAFAWMHRRVPAAGGFVLLMAASAWWSFFYGLYRASADLGWKLPLALATQAGAIVVALAWAVFALQYTGRARWLRPAPLALLAALQVLTLAMALTNEWHHAFWSRFALVERDGRAAIDSVPAWGFWLHVVYSWALMSLAVVLVARRALRAATLYRLQAAAVVAAAAIPWVGNVLHVTGTVRFPLNPMPLLFTLSGVVFFWAIFRLRLLDLVPVAREALVEEMQDGVVVLDEEGRVLDLNPAARTLLGIADDPLGRPVAEALTPLGALLSAAPADAAARERVEMGGPAPARRVDVRVTPLRDRAGRATGRLLVLRDMTEAERREGALALQRAYLEQLFHAAPEGLALLDGADHVIDVNGAWTRLFGWTAEEARGRAINELIVPDSLRDEGNATTARVVGGGTAEFETVRRRRDGALMDVHVTGTPVFVGGRQVGIWGMYRDISERKAAERARAELLERERRARAQAESATRRAAFLADVGTLLSAAFDSGTVYQELARLAVPELADYCLIDEVEADGGTRRVAVAHADPQGEAALLRDERNPADADPETRPVLRVVRTGEPLLVRQVTPEVLDRLSHDDRHRTRFGRTRPASFLIVPLRARGRTLGAITLVRARAGRRYDTADLAVAEEMARRAALAIDNARLYADAREAVHARNAVLGIVSHDLRNPLTAIQLQAETTLAEPGLSPYAREGMEGVVRAADGMDRMIRDLLDVAAIESGRLRVDPLPLPARDLMREAVGMMAPLAEERGVRLVDEGDDGAVVMADRDRVLQVVSNLVGNALRYTPADGVVRVRVEAGEGEVCFTVSDQGPGIPEAERSRVWERFWQADRPGRGGAGLGLPIVRGIVEAHGGRVWVESAPGGGATFGFALPAAPAPLRFTGIGAGERV